MTIIKHVKSTKATTVGIITPTSEIEETASLTPPEEGVTAKREKERESGKSSLIKLTYCWKSTRRRMCISY